MTHSYIVEGITCDGCVAKVKGKLLMHPDITAADVQLEGQKAVISMQRHLTVAELQHAIGRDTKYTIREDHSAGAIDQMEEPRTWFATYKPILLIFAYITLVAAVTSAEGRSIPFMNFMNTFMAGFFLVFSFFKLLDLDGFADSYAMYDIVAKRIRTWGYVYPVVEFGLGLAYVLHFNPFVTNATTFIVMSVSLVGVLQSVLDKKQIRCACLGAIFNLPMSTVTIVEDALMIMMSAVMLGLD